MEDPSEPNLPRIMLEVMKNGWVLRHFAPTIYPNWRRELAMGELSAAYQKAWAADDYEKAGLVKARDRLAEELSPLLNVSALTEEVYSLDQLPELAAKIGTLLVGGVSAKAGERLREAMAARIAQDEEKIRGKIREELLAQAAEAVADGVETDPPPSPPAPPPALGEGDWHQAPSQPDKSDNEIAGDMFMRIAELGTGPEA